MTVYNGSRYLNESVKSILTQTYRDFEFIIVDDCSTDNSYELLKQWSRKDERIKLFQTPSNFGNPGGTGAFAIDRVSTSSKYILPMDQDDIAVSSRLEKSIIFMEKSKHVDICGGWQKMFGKKNRVEKKPEFNAEIKAQMLTSCPLSHSTVIIKKSFLDAHSLNYQNKTAHDYFLWVQALIKGNAIFHNLQEVMLLYRTHSQQLSIKQSSWKELIKDVRRYQLEILGATREDINFHNYWKDQKKRLNSKDVKTLKNHFQKLIALNSNAQIYPEKEFKKHLKSQFRKTVIKSNKVSKLFARFC